MCSTKERRCICRRLSHLALGNSFMSSLAMLPPLQTLLTNLKSPLSLTKGSSTPQTLFSVHLLPENNLAFVLLFDSCVASKESLVRFMLRRSDAVDFVVRTSVLKSSEVGVHSHLGLLRFYKPTIQMLSCLL